jgi:alpha-D-ribose 1-methylphosphonate 5-triphosphate diphosphatase
VNPGDIMDIRLVNAHLILPDREVADGDLLVADGRIAAICAGGGGARELDCGGALLLPGLVDLHCDALEKEVEPRPKALFPLDLAVAQADRRSALCGITTPFHAISFSGSEWGVRNDRLAGELARTVQRQRGLTDARVHLRYEVTEPACEPIIAGLIDEGACDLLSFMDHTPGRGQFRTFESYSAYFRGAHHASEDEVVRMVAAKQAQQAGAPARIAALAARAGARGIALATHDDDSPEFVAAAASIGVAMSEFPINLPTTAAAHARGIATILGAPNIVRGGSQSGNMRALDAVLAGTCDCLCADYHPPSMLAAALALPELAGLSLAQAVAMVSAAPARAAGLRDRGALVTGLRADLALVRRHGTLALVELTMVAGRVVCDTRAAWEREPALAAP